MPLRTSIPRLALAALAALSMATSLGTPVAAQTPDDRPLPAEPSLPTEQSAPAPCANDAARLAFATHLMEQRDYFRAITVYKELAFRAEDPVVRAQHRYRIGMAYRLSRHYELSEQVLTSLLDAPEAKLFSSRVRLQIALDQLGLGSPGAAAYHLDLASRAGEGPRARVVQGFIDLQSGDLAHLRAQLATPPPAPADPSLQRLEQSLLLAADRLDNAPRKSPALAATLSLLVPGAGQVYTGHYADALQAFGFVGAFGFTTYLAYDYDHTRGNPYLLTGVAAAITAFLHLANVLGAERTARYHNARQKQLLVEPLRRPVLEMLF